MGQIEEKFAKLWKYKITLIQRDDEWKHWRLWLDRECDWYERICENATVEWCLDMTIKYLKDEKHLEPQKKAEEWMIHMAVDKWQRWWDKTCRTYYKYNQITWEKIILDIVIDEPQQEDKKIEPLWILKLDTDVSIIKKINEIINFINNKTKQMASQDIPRALKDLADRYPWYEFLAKNNNLLIKWLQDSRTVEEMQSDYDIGIEMENRIIKYLKTLGVVYTTKYKDKWLNPSLYVPDCIILRRNQLLALEIKYTKYKIDKVQRKRNQYDRMKWWEWCLLQVSGNRFCLIPRNQEWTIVLSDKSYCNKDCIEFEVVWRSLDELNQLFF